MLPHATVRILNYKCNGAPFWNMFTLAPMKDSDGTTRFLVGVQVRRASLERLVRHQPCVLARACGFEKRVPPPLPTPDTPTPQTRTTHTRARRWT